MSTQKHTQVLIAGGSVAGLTLANTLEQLGIDFLVLEKYEKVAPDLGASIGIFPNGLRILDQIGCYDAIKAVSADADPFRELSMMNDSGHIILKAKDASGKMGSRLGYKPIFLDRQMLIQILYDNLRDKSKVLTNKGVAKVEQLPGKVQVTTSHGETITGEVLVGADGIHSVVRREMWRLADQETPGYFSVSERSKAPTEYCCIFGISPPTNKVKAFSSFNVVGQNSSYLISTGPNHRIYWFLFKKLPTTAHGLYDDIPRFTDEERDTLAAEHAADPLAADLTFGELYATRTTATLQALPEVVFKKWHYNRIMTIGDAAHKFNPIGGQGGNSAIEDAVVLADQLHTLLQSKDKSTPLTDANIVHAFQETQRIRHERASKMLKASHDLQSLQAMDTLVSKFIAKYIMPMSGSDKMVDMICESSLGAARCKSLPMPDRPHSALWDDEKEPKLVNWTRVGMVASVVFGALAVMTASNSQSTMASMSKVLLSVQRG
ncbi:hypothetical protein C7974DRAFT_123267 [Boeremia exigua]|uniref:uncharacterized protein n=1 Tax=Boeremia exigua TaxID=749465 RepID=UPI001E8E077D|nr:uncharacterized protein C7974DRAFT_123267 [Boeremia exigua]KAH6638911.1 hypothetical protein C7974DRAFT_123267 [Boeremia exigua]